MKLAVLCMAAAGLILLPLWVSAVGWLLTPPFPTQQEVEQNLIKSSLGKRQTCSYQKSLSTILAQASERPSKCTASEGLLCLSPYTLCKTSVNCGSAAALENDSSCFFVNLKPDKPQTAVFSILLRNSICICSCVRAVCITSEDEVLV